MKETKPLIRISPRVRALKNKLLALDTEAGFWGIMEGNLVVDFLLPKQVCHGSEFDPDMDHLQELIVQACVNGAMPDQIRYWWHKHPKGVGANPSSTDVETLDELISDKSWYIMSIESEGGSQHCTLASRPDGPGGKFTTHTACDLCVDFSVPFNGVTQEEFAQWDELIKERVTRKTWWDKSGYKYMSYDKSGRTKIPKSNQGKSKYTKTYIMGPGKVIEGDADVNSQFQWVELYHDGGLEIENSDKPWALIEGVEFVISNRCTTYKCKLQKGRVHVTESYDPDKKIDQTESTYFLNRGTLLTGKRQGIEVALNHNGKVIYKVANGKEESRQLGMNEVCYIEDGDVGYFCTFRGKGKVEVIESVIDTKDKDSGFGDESNILIADDDPMFDYDLYQ